MLLFLGRVHEKKGCDLLFRGFAAALRALEADCATEDEFHLLMAGPDDGVYADDLKALASELGIADRTTWTGMLGGGMKWSAFYSADAFVLPSHQENFGIAVAEALACGTPVLISNRVNIWREIQKHQAGLVESDDLEGTTALLKSWIQMPREEMQQMRARAVACFRECFDMDRVAEAFIDKLRLLGVPH